MNTPTQKEKARIRMIAMGMLFVLPIIILWSSLTYTVDSGHAGLIFHTFGNGVNPESPPKTSGFHIKAPWDKVYQYEVRQQEINENLEVLSSNLLKITMDMTLFYQPQYDNLGFLEVERGMLYEAKVIQPAMRSVAREVIAKYIPEEFNTTKREEIQLEIEDRLAEKLADNYIQLNDVLIRNIKLPTTLEQAIERKLQQEQESLEYEFRIEKASKEAERKRIEAEGIRDFQNIVSQSINDDLLQWKGIEATTELSNSNNAKIVVIGSGENGLPLILGD
ncbi:MAG: peptidase [Crocinitomicaceae bacterium]|nr:peptidase [Crocinitomicaceae bacterium]|tara:strand:- start:14831 stop:15664 length:834 start_codon:yes stop_codon:yes gene_type:complete